ncbi:M14 family metallopeptidase [Gloeothece verrucosa]|uniref:Peptidase M14 carboxypeptidase A n=1 Tax=Gloeothece verrucosa (strain PCC 7822) TaxID=497965 RepID=E0UBS7_GLOV7|nr:M14 family metallopeptidase [Gloeothece verrucosa]ADN15142.1 peptidase M14 carboxypeptidase A [Gloeothece verrucosa PCC 7822]
MLVPPFDFSHYYTYEELVKFLHQMAESYPHLIKLEVIGQSYAKRDIWLATLTSQDSGLPLEKPGYWIDGNTHAGEVTGSAIVLYIIHHLLTQYKQDPQVTRLLNDYTVYVLPRIAVDGAEKYLTTPYRLRSSIRPYPYSEGREGLYLEDINGDGLILQMRLKDDCGGWKVAPEDPRIMIPREPDEFGGTYYTLLPEGLIRNYDGYNVKLAPTYEGLDFNRNYPAEWVPEGEQKGAGSFPFSEPETRAEAEFWSQHPNINGFMTYHTSGAVILRPYSTEPDDHFPYEDLEIYQLIGEKGTNLTGYECVSVYHDFRDHPTKVTHGAMDDYCYDHFGWFGFTVELWDAPTQAGVKKEHYVKWDDRHPLSDDLKLMQWNDEKLAGKGFIPWQPFQHPQLGEVEIGGWNFKQVWQNAPVEYLPELCEKQCRFAISHALMCPRLAIARTDLTHHGGDIYHLVLQLENQGFLPTYTSEKARKRKSVQPIQVSLSLGEGVSLVSGEKEQEIGHLEGRSNKAFSNVAKGYDYRCTVEWVIKGVSGSEIEVIAKAQRAGTVRKKISF